QYAEKPIRTKRIPKKKPIKQKKKESKITIKHEKEPHDIKASIEKDIKKISGEKKVKQKEESVPESKIEDLGFKIEDPVEDIPGVGKKTGIKLREIGIETVGDLINANLEEAIQKLEDVTWISKSRLEEWQTVCSNNII
ncbi:MAG: hypothetical protein EU548_10035, partial [Promethearchaeota archaeon]